MLERARKGYLLICVEGVKNDDSINVEISHSQRDGNRTAHNRRLPGRRFLVLASLAAGLRRAADLLLHPGRFCLL